MIILAVIDILISSFIVSPLVVSFWRGTWEYMNYSQSFPAVWTLYISTVIIIAFTLLREPLYEKRNTGFLGQIIARVYIYVFGVVGVTYWRAVFLLIDSYLDWRGTVITAGASVLILAGISSLSTLLGPPFVLCFDHRQKDVFIFPTMFGREVSSS